MIEIPPDVKFHPAYRLFTWHLHGVLDSDMLNKIIAFIEYKEQDTEEPFNRFTDLSHLTAIELDFEYVVRASMHRRRAYVGHEHVKAAFFATTSYSTYLAKVHALLTEYTPLEVAVFSEVADAADWLGVPTEVLLP